MKWPLPLVQFLPREDGIYLLTDLKSPTDFTTFIVENGLLYCRANRFVDWGWMSGAPVEMVERLLHPIQLTWEKIEKEPIGTRTGPYSMYTPVGRSNYNVAVVRNFVDSLPSKELVFLDCDDPEWEERQMCGPSYRPFVAHVLPFDSETGTVFPVAEFSEASFRGRLKWDNLMAAWGVTFTAVPDAMLKVCRTKGV